MRECVELTQAAVVEDAVSAAGDVLDVFLISNELWGGSGSIADQAGVALRREDRRKIEHALVELGKEQIKAGKVNRRTAMWVSVFAEWEKAGI